MLKTLENEFLFEITWAYFRENFEIRVLPLQKIKENDKDFHLKTENLIFLCQIFFSPINQLKKGFKVKKLR